MMDAAIAHQAVLADLQLQQASVAQLKTRLDEALGELQRETTVLWQELADHRERADKASEKQDAWSSRVERLEHALAEEIEARCDAERANCADIMDLRNFINLESHRSRDVVIAEAHNALRGSHRAEGSLLHHKQPLAGLPEEGEVRDAEGSGEAVTNGSFHDGDAYAVSAGMPPSTANDIVYGEGMLHSRLETLNNDEDGFRDVLDRVEARLRDSAHDNALQLGELDQRIREEWTGLRGWVDAAVVAVVNRISSLELTLQTELADRSKSMDEVLSGLSKVGKLQQQVQSLTEEVRQTQELSSQNMTTSRLRACRLSSSTMPSAGQFEDGSRPATTRSDLNIRVESAPNIDIGAIGGVVPRAGHTNSMQSSSGPVWAAGVRYGSSLQVPSAGGVASLSTPREREQSAPPRTNTVRNVAPSAGGGTPTTAPAPTASASSPAQAVSAPVPRPDRTTGQCGQPQFGNGEGSPVATAVQPTPKPIPAQASGSQTVPASTTSGHGTLAGREALFPTISPPSGQVLRSGRRQ